MELGLADRVVLVTGGAKGIGAACVRSFAAEGARVAVVDRDTQAGGVLTELLQRDRTQVLFVAAELSSTGDCRTAVEETVRSFGRIDILVNNAGFNDSIGLDQSPEKFVESLKQNLVPAFALTHFCLDHLKRAKGAIVNVGSKVALTGQGATSGYAAAKGGINALTREWALALAPFDVRVNAVLPAECLTHSYEQWFASLDEPQATRAAIERMIPLGRRMTRPEEVADAIVFLASNRASHTTGQILLVDGGYTHLDRAFGREHAKWK